MTEIKWRKKAKDSAKQQDMKLHAVLNEAAQSFVSNGYDKTSLDKIAASLNVSKPALYYYVKNKEDMFLKCLHISLEMTLEMAKDADRKGSNGLEKLIQFFRNHAATSAKKNNFGAALILEGERSLDGKNKKELRKIKRNVEDYVAQYLVEGMKDGSVKTCNPKYVAMLLFSAFNLLHLWFDQRGTMSSHEVADELLNPVLEGIRSD